MKANRFNWLQLAGTFVVVVALVVVLFAIGRDGPARVEGDTPAERIACINRLAADRPAGAGDAIAHAAIDEPHALVRQAALMALGELANDGQYRPTFEAGTRDVAPWAREVATEALGRFADAAAVRRLGELVATDPTSGVRCAAARGLAQIATPPAVALLVEAVEKNVYPPVRLVALDVLEGLLARHGAEGKEPWAPERWNRLKAEVERVRPLAKIGPQAEKSRGKHEHAHEHGGKTARTRPVNAPPGK